MTLLISSLALVALLPIIALQSIKHTGAAFALVMSMFAIEHVLLQNRLGISLGGSTINIFVGLVCVGAFTLAVLQGRINGFSIPWQAWCAYLLAGFAVLSLSWAPNTDEGVHLVKNMVPYFVVSFVISPFFLTNAKEIEQFLLWFTLLGIAIGLGLAGSEVDHRAVIINVGGGRTQRLNPLASGSFGGYVVICSLFILYRYELNKPKKFLLLATTGLGIFVVSQSGSRGQLLALLLTSLIWVPVTAQVQQKRSYTIIYSILVGFVALGYYFLEKLDLLFRFSGERVTRGAAGRFDAALRLLERQWNEGPTAWLIGLGNSSSYRYVGGYPHIVPLEVLAEEGIIGFGLFCAFILSVCLLGYEMVATKTFQYRSEVCLFAALFSFEFLLTFKQGSLIGQTQMFCFGLVILFISHRWFTTSPEWVPWSQEA